MRRCLQISTLMLVIFGLMNLSLGLQYCLLPSKRTKAIKLRKAQIGSDSEIPTEKSESRREMIHRSCIAMAGVAAAVTTSHPTAAWAAVTDETKTFADTWWDSTTSSSDKPGYPSKPQSKAEPSDEISITIPKQDLQSKGGLGIELSETEFRTNIRVFVKSVLPGSLGEKLGIQKDWIVVSVNGQSAERTNAEGVTMMVFKAVKNAGLNEDLKLQFRDNSAFQKQLSGGLSQNQQVTTQVAPSGDTTQRNPDGSIRTGSITSQTDQRVSVEQLVPPKLCNRKAMTDDLLEISYIGKVVETGDVFDGSAVKINGKAIPGRGDDVSLFLVLGKQPFGQFPPGWDVALQGMCVGERRRVIIPPILAYGSQGLPRRGIPPDATLQYDITLVSLNGLATPQ